MADDRDDIARTLPDDLLSLIFREFVSISSGGSSFLRPERTNAPLNLSWVNTRWRRVALATPDLWTSIALPNTLARTISPSPNPTNGDAELLKLHILRSGNSLPLSFALDYGGVRNNESCLDGIERSREAVEDEEHIAGITRLTLILDGVRDRWRVVVLRCRTLEALSVLLSSLVLGAPLLEHLLISTTPPPRMVHSSGFDGEALHVWRMLDLARCPKLESVVLQCPQLRLNPFILDDGPLETLGSLAINSSASQTDAFTWLQCSPNLETLSLQFINAPRFILPHALPLTMDCLVHFALTCLNDPGRDSSDPMSFLHLLCLPALRSFSLMMDGSSGSNQGWPHVLDLLRRSGAGSELRLGPCLEELELLGTPMTASELLETLELVPQLKRLTIDDALTEGDVLLRLSGPPIITNSDTNDTRPPLCPELEVLTLHACCGSLPALARLVASRSQLRGLSEDQLHSKIDSLLPKVGNRQEFRTLKALVLVHSYQSLPPVAEHPMFRSCQEDGLKIVQRPLPPSQILS